MNYHLMFYMFKDFKAAKSMELRILYIEHGLHRDRFTYPYFVSYVVPKIHVVFI